ncbi:MAG: thioredoxin domain-containing protein, partial [Spirochaetaceae bacterium]|nr:thioredoxin domain-containing protein [Spirochaetaceae bacterium]
MLSIYKPTVYITSLLLLGMQFGQSVYASGSGNNNSTTNESENKQEQNTMTEIPWSESNRLKGTGSPYLEQHTENPVHWIPWGEEAFEEARRRNLPILVSIGYSSCHWCHVMAHESFENNEIATVMNASQVNIKVDREQHPGVDAVYMEAAQTLTGSGGWPLNVFVDHEGRPFLAVTYLPPDRWLGLITEVNRIWREDPGRIDEIADTITAQLAERTFPGDTDPATLPEALMKASRETYDSTNPGFTMGTSLMKFPPSQTIDWLLEYGGDKGMEMAVNILTTMMDSGLHDRVGGGFHRYS